MSEIFRVAIVDDREVRHSQIKAMKSFRGRSVEFYDYYSPNEFLEFFLNQNSPSFFRILFLDNDMGTAEDGVTIAKALAEHANYISIKQIVIHSMNVVAAEKMESILQALSNDTIVTRIPASDLIRY